MSPKNFHPFLNINNSVAVIINAVQYLGLWHHFILTHEHALNTGSSSSSARALTDTSTARLTDLRHVVIDLPIAVVVNAITHFHCGTNES